MNEIFKEIPNYENYLISNFGTVKRTDGRIMKLIEDNGYKRVGLYKNGKQKLFKVHRLVAEAFIPNPKNLPFINHKNEVKSDNNFRNLEWCDCKYNLNYGTCLERRGKTLSKIFKNRADMSKKVCQYDTELNYINTYLSIQEASRQTGIPFSLISKCCNKYLQKTHNFIWKFETM